MGAVAFDTLKFSKKLIAAGFTEKQAETLATEQAELVDQKLATKSDLKAHEERLTGRMEAYEERLTGRMEAHEERTANRIESLEQRLTVRFGGMLVVAVGAIAALQKLL